MVKTNLRQRVKLHHGIGQRIGIGSESRNEAKHGTVEGTIDLGQRRRTWVVHIYHRHVAQESSIDKRCHNIPST